jgi:hypothetical protein
MCDPTWEVCDSPSTGGNSNSGSMDGSANTMSDEVVLVADDVFINIARGWSVLSAGTFWMAYWYYQQIINFTSITNKA